MEVGSERRQLMFLIPVHHQVVVVVRRLRFTHCRKLVNEMLSVTIRRRPPCPLEPGVRP